MATNKNEYNYYIGELLKLKPDDTYSQSIVIHDGQGKKTNFISLNKESIPVVIQFLKLEARRLKKLEAQRLKKLKKAA